MKNLHRAVMAAVSPWMWVRKPMGHLRRAHLLSFKDELAKLEANAGVVDRRRDEGCSTTHKIISNQLHLPNWSCTGAIGAHPLRKGANLTLNESDQPSRPAPNATKHSASGRASLGNSRSSRRGDARQALGRFGCGLGSLVLCCAGRFRGGGCGAEGGATQHQLLLPTDGAGEAERHGVCRRCERCGEG